jgi:plasmid stability protein
MPDLLIRNIDAQLRQRLAASARSHRRSLSEEARMLLKKALLDTPERRKMGAALLELIPEKFSGDDLTFEAPGELSRPPDFE